jgi:hypothetical protein
MTPVRVCETGAKKIVGTVKIVLNGGDDGAAWTDLATAGER